MGMLTPGIIHTVSPARMDDGRLAEEAIAGCEDSSAFEATLHWVPISQWH